MQINVIRFDSLPSTNTEAAEQAGRGAAEGTCIIAAEQTAGRGRLGRRWAGSKGTGLYLSIVLRPAIEPRSLPLMTLMAGLAVHDTMHEIGLRPDIKWVNDVLIGERKISGILAETIETPLGRAVIVGIGINIRSEGLPPEIAAIATSLSDQGVRINAETIERILLRRLTDRYTRLLAEGGCGETIAEWAERSSYFAGKAIRATLGTSTIEGITDGLEPDGGLRVKLPDGSVNIIRSGEVERLRSI
ncbi:MAG: biotin--[acetyl-CoA-carboxylase] ligase [Chloracidobacterium sp.]|nr:biotin--[acetyl-CoA-carboxylase] ligase [Chloracidobacterium sp.]MCO5333732.1 biotin--[acetyl-CoA-carboxylase] ligase [Pyrinomonadaceae bacterium]